jgi:radical SAM protein with 4Fe4S-binding SPASM domain
LVDRQTAEALAECLDIVYISTDGVAELHDHVRGTRGTFGRLSRCLEYFLEARGTRHSPLLICNTTVSGHNAHALSRIAEFASQAGYDEVHFEYAGEFNDEIVASSRIGQYEPSPIFRQAGESCLVTASQVAELREQLDLVHRHARRKNAPGGEFRVSTVSIDVLSDDDLVHGTVPGRRCFVDHNEIVIDPYGNVVPCFFFDTYSVGDVRNGALDGSLETPERREFRTFRDHGKLEMCKYCIHSVVRNRTGADIIKREFVERLRHASVAGNT